jgi:hypothetical protein
MLRSDQILDAIGRYTTLLTELYRPADEHEKTLIAEMANARALKEHASNLMVVDLLRSMDHAKFCWDSDRAEYIDKLGGRLAKDLRVARALARTKQGAEWLLEKWTQLRWPLEANCVWTEAQRSVAFDLLGIEVEFRDQHPLVRPDADVATLTRVVDQEVGRLQDLMEERLLRSDETHQEAAKVGLTPEADSTTRNLMKHENRHWREFQRLKQELLEYRALRAATGAEPRDDAAASPVAPPTASDRKGPAPTPRPEPTAAERKFLNERWYYDTLTTYAEAPDEHECSEDPPAAEEPARAEARAPMPAAAPDQASAGSAANTMSEEAAARAREEQRSRHLRAEQRKARNKARRRRC